MDYGLKASSCDPLNQSISQYSPCCYKSTWSWLWVPWCIPVSLKKFITSGKYVYQSEELFIKTSEKLAILMAILMAVYSISMTSQERQSLRSWLLINNYCWSNSTFFTCLIKYFHQAHTSKDSGYTYTSG